MDMLYEEGVTLKILDTRKVRKVGNSSVVTLPVHVLDKLNIENDEDIVFVEHDNKVYIQSAVSKEEKFNSKMDQITKEYDDVFKELVDR